ncbi:oligoribonuclease [Trichophyton mentagrophytes]|nr:oligoribonuclease [Trichophyton mentagrophytes]
MALQRSSDPLVWIDCQLTNEAGDMQMTGLDPASDRILQICCYITDAQLNLLEPEGFEAVVHQPQEVLDRMNAWCIDTHGRSGLTAAVLASPTTAEEAARELLAYIKQYVPTQRTALLAGNSVHADRAFLAQPPYVQVLDWLHYRILDVSSVKEAARRWASDEVLRDAPAKKGVHLAREDILESIEEMKYYRQKLFVS